MRTIDHILANTDWTIEAIFTSGEVRIFDVKPLLTCEAFEDLRDLNHFMKVHNRGYYIEWENEADLSSDTIYLEGTAKKRRAA